MQVDEFTALLEFSIRQASKDRRYRYDALILTHPDGMLLGEAGHPLGGHKDGEWAWTLEQCERMRQVISDAVAEALRT